MCLGYWFYGPNLEHAFIKRVCLQLQNYKNSQCNYLRMQTGQHSPSTNVGLAHATGGHVIWWHTILDSCHWWTLEMYEKLNNPGVICTHSCMTWHYLASTFGAAVYNPVFLIIKQPAVLPTHVFLLWVPHFPQGLLHNRVLLCLNIQQWFAAGN